MASRRLTKTLREVFVRAVMDDVPQPDEDQCSKEFQELVNKEMPPEVLAAFLKYPDWLNPESHCVTWGRAANERSVWLRYKWFSSSQDDFSTEMKEYIEKLADIVENRNKLRAKIKGVAESCTTIAHLKIALPELEKYMPEDTPAPTKQLPVMANLMADVIALGWPGGKIVNAQIERMAA